MPRYKMIIEYDGTPFVGWQRQADLPSVQGAIEDALFKCTHEVTQLHGAGRTDAGVHAIGQVAHVDLISCWKPFQLREAINFHLKPRRVAVLSIEEVPPDFHARFSAQYRAYAYRIIMRYAPLTLEQQRVWRVAKKLDVTAMQQAAVIFQGTHDFSAFRARECQAQSPIKTLDRLEVRTSDNMIEIYAKARSFLHHQVRNMVGALVWIGQDKWTVEHLSTVLNRGDRCHGAPTAPACGLYFLEAGYR